MPDADTEPSVHDIGPINGQSTDVEAASPVAGKEDVKALNEPEPPFSILTKREKWGLVIMVGMSSLFR